MNPTTLELCPLRACQHLAIDQHKGLSCQALSPLPSSPGSSAGCIQSQLTDKRNFCWPWNSSEKNLKKPHTCFGEPLLWSFSESLHSEAVFKPRFSSLSPSWATLQQHCSHTCTWTHTPLIQILTQPMDLSSWSELHLALLVWTCLAGTEL